MRPGDIIGGIFRINDKFITSLEGVNSMRKFSGIKPQYIVQKLGDISGVWFEDIYVNDELITKFSKCYPIEYHRNVLPSDSNFRLDVLAHRMGDLKRSQHEKEILEEIQRTDRRLREKMAKTRNGKK